MGHRGRVDSIDALAVLIEGAGPDALPATTTELDRSAPGTVDPPSSGAAPTRIAA